MYANIDVLTKLDEDFPKNHPHDHYEGALPADADALDYVTITLKGVRIA